MARGSIVWRCQEMIEKEVNGRLKRVRCGTHANGPCGHKRGRYVIIYPVQQWDLKRGKIIKRKKWETVGPRKKDAEKRLAERLKTVHEGTYRELQQITFVEFADKWLAEYARGTTKPYTYVTYEYILRGLKRALGHLPLQAIREQTVQGYVSSTLAAGSAPKTVKNRLFLLKTMLRHAVRWGYLASNPAAEVKPPRVERVEMKILTPEKVEHLLTATTERGEPAIPPGWYLPIKLAIFSGLRQGEEFALHVGDLDFHNGQVRVQRALTVLPKWYKPGGQRHLIGSPKSKTSIRNVDLPSDLLEELQAYVGGLPDQEPDRPLFASSEGTILDPANVVRPVFEKVLRNAGLPPMRWHDLRHTYVSLQIAAGANHNCPAKLPDRCCN